MKEGEADRGRWRADVRDRKIGKNEGKTAVHEQREKERER